MTPDEWAWCLLRQIDDVGELELSGGPWAPAWVGEELSFVYWEAAAAARLAYEQWARSPTADAYARYRAAQDRADAGQGALANWYAAGARRAGGRA